MPAANAHVQHLHTPNPCCGAHAGSTLQTNQYSVTEYDTPANPLQLQLPSVWFLYDLSPVTVAMAQTRRSLLHLLVRFCAVVGGVFAVTGKLSCGCAAHVWVHEELSKKFLAYLQT